MPPSCSGSCPGLDAGKLGEKQECESTDETAVSFDTPSPETHVSPRAPPEAAPVPEWDATDRSPGRRKVARFGLRAAADMQLRGTAEDARREASVAILFTPPVITQAAAPPGAEDALAASLSGRKFFGRSSHTLTVM
ncbi:hypothetical protein Emag_002349 [Eimeria magna]